MLDILDDGKIGTSKKRGYFQFVGRAAIWGCQSLGPVLDVRRDGLFFCGPPRRDAGNAMRSAAGGAMRGAFVMLRVRRSKERNPGREYAKDKRSESVEIFLGVKTSRMRDVEGERMDGMVRRKESKRLFGGEEGERETFSWEKMEG